MSYSTELVITQGSSGYYFTRFDPQDIYVPYGQSPHCAVVTKQNDLVIDNQIFFESPYIYAPDKWAPHGSNLSPIKTQHKLPGLSVVHIEEYQLSFKADSNTNQGDSPILYPLTYSVNGIGQEMDESANFLRIHYCFLKQVTVKVTVKDDPSGGYSVSCDTPCIPLTLGETVQIKLTLVDKTNGKVASFPTEDPHQAFVWLGTAPVMKLDPVSATSITLTETDVHVGEHFKFQPTVEIGGGLYPSSGHVEMKSDCSS